MADYTPFDASTSPVFESDYTDSGEFTGYVTAHDESSRSIDELGTHESNRWTHQGYFNDPPSITADSGTWTTYRIQLTDSTFSLDYFTLDDDQAYVDISSIEPDDGDQGVEFSVSLGAGYGPLSVGTTAVEIDTSFNVDDDDYQRTEWNVQYPIAEPIPTSQEDSVGVRYDVDAQGTPGTYTIENFQMHGWEVIETDRTGSLSVYSTSQSYYHDQGIDIVE